jgi:hypothetical protein
MSAGEDVIVLATGSKETDVNIGSGDVVVLHVDNFATREIMPDGSVRGVEFLVNYCQKAGARVICQLDDDYTAHRDIQDVDASIPLMLSDLYKGLQRANLTVVATPPLEQVYGRHARRITTVRNYPPERCWHTPLLERDHDVAWMGYVGTESEPMPHRRDFGEVLPALDGLNILTIGDGGIVDLVEKFNDLNEFNDSDYAWIDHTHVGPQPQEVPYGKAIPLYQQMSRAEAGICPLAEHDFNRSKSWIKALEFAIVGTIPVVPAWHPAYQELAEIVPLMAYADLSGLRDRIDETLGAPEQDRLALSGMIRGVSTDLTMERAGVPEWQRAFAMLND